MRRPGSNRRLRVHSLGAALAFLLLVPAGSVGAETILGRWGLRPRYDSEYKVYRSETGWSQRLGLDRSSSWANLNTNLSIETRDDPERNDYRYGNNMFRAAVNRDTPLGTLSFDGQALRQYTQTSLSLDSRRSDDFSLSNGVDFISGGTNKLSLAFGGGRVEQRQVKEGRRGRTATYDRTLASGWQGDALLDALWQPDPTLKFTAKANWEGGVQSSATLHTEDAERTRKEATDRSRANAVNGEAVWTRFTALNLQAKFSFSGSRAQYYQASAQAQETKTSELGSFTLAAAGQPLRGVNYTAKVAGTKSDYDYAVENNSDNYVATRDYEGTANYDVPAFSVLGVNLGKFLGLAGSSIQGEASLSKKRTERRNTAFFDNKTTRLELRMLRPLGERFDLTLKGVTQLDQDFYDDRSLDIDRLWTATSANLRYHVEKKITINTIYAANRRDVVNIPRARTGQNQVEKDYRVTTDYQIYLPGQIIFSQNFQISAAYTYYTYAEENNALTRMNRVTSKATVPLFDRTKISLDHIFERSDAGAYLYDENHESQGYSRATERLRQDLRAQIEYALSSMIRISMIERLGITSSKELRTGKVTRRDNHELTGRIALQHDFPGQLALTASFERTQSNQVDPFWRINAKVEKQFE